MMAVYPGHRNVQDPFCKEETKEDAPNVIQLSAGAAGVSAYGCSAHI